MEDFRVDLGIFLNPENLQTVQSQIDSLSSRNVTLKINTQDVLKDVNLIKQQLKSIGVDFGGTTGVSTAVKKEMAATEKEVKKTISRISDSLRTGLTGSLSINDSGKQIQETVRKYFESIGSATTEILRTSENNINGIVVSVKNAIGEVERLHYALNDEGDGFRYDGSRSTDNYIKLQEEATRKATQAQKEYETQISKNNATVTKYTADLTSLQSKYTDLNAAKPITDTTHTEALETQYQNATRAVEALKSADKDTFTELKANADAEIQKLKDMVTQFRNAEYAANQLRAKPVETIKINEGYALDEFEAKVRQAGITSQEFYQKIAQLRTQLSNVGDKQSLTEYLNVLSNVKAESQALIAQKKTDDQQAAQSQKGINEVFQRTLELEKQIGRTKVKIAGLDPEKDKAQIAELNNQLNTLVNESQLVKGEFSSAFSTEQILKLNDVIKETENRIAEIKAQLQAAQSQKVAEIKTNFSNGQYEKEVNAVKTSFDSLRNTTTELQTAMNGLDTAYENLKTAQAGSDPQKLVVAEEAYVNALKKVKNQLDINTRTEREQISAEKMAQGKQALYSQIDVWLKNNSAAAKKFGAELREIQAQLKGTDAVDLKALRSQFQETTRQAKILGVTGKSLKDQFSQTFKTLGMYFSSTALIMRGVQYVRQMYDNVLKVDTAMTGLYRVTNLTGEQYAKLYDDMTESAKKYGSTLDDIINSTASWVRLGFDSGTSEKLSEITAMYQHVADLDYNTAVKNLVTTYKGFQSELDEVNNGDTAKSMTEIVDILDKLNNEMPVTAAQVGEGLTKSAAIMEQSGASLAETASMIVGGGSVTQDFDAFGNALRISAMRIRSMKGQLEELGEEVDENVSSISKMQTQILNLTHGKVNIFEDDGKSYKNITQVYREIAGVLDSLSDTESSELIELIAGKNRANQILGMLTHWSDVETALSKSLSANGTAMAENQKYMDSMQGKIAATQAAWQALSNTLLSSDFLKGLIDGGQTLLNIVNAISKTIFGFPALLAVISGYLSASKNIGFFTTISQDLTSAITGASTLSNKMGILGNSFKDISMAWQAYGKAGLKNIFANTSDKLVTSMDKEMLENFFTQIKNGVPKVEALENTMLGASKGARDLALSVDTSKEGLKNFRTTLDGVQVAEKGYTATTIGARVATVAFQAALSFGLAIAIQAVVSGLQYLIHYQEKQAEATHDQAQKSQEAVDKAKEEANSLDELISKYKELKSVGNLDEDGRAKVRDIQKEITKLVGDQASNLDLVNGNLDTELEKLKGISKEQAKQNVPKYRTAAADAMNENLASTEGNGRFEIDGSTGELDQKDRRRLFQIFSGYAHNNGGYWASGKTNSLGDFIGNQDSFRVNDDMFRVDFAEITYLARQQAIADALSYLEENLENPNNSDIYNRLSRYKSQLDEYIQQRQEKLESFVITDLSSGEYGNTNVTSLDDFKSLRQKIIDDLTKDSTIQEALKKGFINEEWIANQADNYLSGLSQFKTYNEQYLQEQKKSADNTGNVIDNTTEKVDRFKQLMEEKGTDKNPSFVEGIEKSVEQLQKLEDALVKFESGTLTDKEKTSLFKAFPQLTAYADNLGAGIRNLLGEMRGDVVSQFTEKINEFKKAGATEEEIAQLEAYERTILNIADSVDSVKNALDSMKSVFKDLDGVIKDYNENQYFSLESLEKLGQNGQRYLSYLSYENGQLKINEEAYKKLVLAQIDEIETKATLQATTDLQSLTDETAAKEYLAKVNIDLAQSQLTAAQAAFQYQLALKLAQGGSVAKAAQKVADNLNSLRNIFASARSQVDDYAAAMLGATSATEKKAKASEKAKKALESEQRALEHSKKALEDEKKALEDTKSEYEKAQKAIEDLIKWTQNYIKQIKEDEVKALQDKKEKFDELIEKQKESLQAEKDLHDYEKSVGEKQNDLASNALKVSVSSLDDSAAGKKAYKQAQEEYKKSQTDMEDFLYDHSIETREKALDQLKEDTDKSYDEQIKTIQDYLNNEVQLYRDACSMIDNDNGTLYGKLLNYCLTYTTTGKNEFNHMWSSAQSAMQQYNTANLGTFDLLNNLQGRIYEVDTAIDTVSQSISEYEDAIDAVQTKIDDLGDAAEDTINKINNIKTVSANGNWYVDYNGKRYSSFFDNKNDAINDLRKQVTQSLGFNATNPLLINDNTVKHYASGTRHTPSTFISQEKGLEAIFAKNPNGSGTYTITTPDSQVFDNKRTDNLYDFASNPEKFLSEKGLSPLSNEELANLGLWGDNSQLGMINSAFGVGGLSGLIEKITGGSRVSTNNTSTTNDINPMVNIYIQGNADQSVVNALEKQADNIVQRTINQIMKIPVRNKFVI